jgi:hypothetical protein
MKNPARTCPTGLMNQVVYYLDFFPPFLAFFALDAGFFATFLAFAIVVLVFGY